MYIHNHYHYHGHSHSRDFSSFTPVALLHYKLVLHEHQPSKCYHPKLHGSTDGSPHFPDEFLKDRSGLHGIIPKMIHKLEMDLFVLLRLSWILLTRQKAHVQNDERYLKINSGIKLDYELK